jgi:hypothetical protein
MRTVSWDNLPASHKSEENGVKYRQWSLSDSGCVLKHVARHHILGVPRPDGVSHA